MVLLAIVNYPGQNKEARWGFLLEKCEEIYVITLLITDGSKKWKKKKKKGKGKAFGLLDFWNWDALHELHFLLNIFKYGLYNIWFCSLPFQEKIIEIWHEDKKQKK